MLGLCFSTFVSNTKWKHNVDELGFEPTADAFIVSVVALRYEVTELNFSFYR